MNLSLRRPNGMAFTFVGMLMLVAVLAILAALLLPALARAKAKAQRIQCVNNLKQAGLAFRLWASDNGDLYPMAVSTNRRGTAEFVPGGNAFTHYQAMAEELMSSRILVCPADGDRTAAASFRDLRNEHLSYFVGLDAQLERPNTLLAGDRNITNGLPVRRTILELRPERPAGWTETIHRGAGNIGLADGSVQQMTTMKLREALRDSGDSTNRIALPE